MFLDSMHIRSEASNQQAYMRIFWAHVQPVVGATLNLEATSRTAKP
jgi:hypothetical protein